MDFDDPHFCWFVMTLIYLITLVFISAYFFLLDNPWMLL